MMPHLLHFTWKTTELPREMADYYGKWQKLHPGWEIRLWTDESMRAFVAEAYPEFLAIYDSYPKMIQRADAFRYLVLGRLGGIYADLDVEPFAAMTPLLEHDAFLGIEPLEHIFPDRIHQGVPFLLTNAFMGSVPGHPLWQAVIAALPKLVGQETFYATGPSMITAMVLRLPPAQRPVLLLPEVWSPLLSNGKRTRSDAAARDMLSAVGQVLDAGAVGRLVSHKWMTTWVPWHMRANQWVEVLQVPTVIKWWLRARRHPQLAGMVIPDPITPYLDQAPEPLSAHPRVHVAVRLGLGELDEQLAQALARLDYPAEQLSVAYHADEAGAAGLNAMLAARPDDAEFVLVLDGRVRDLPSDALIRMLEARRPVVAASCVDAEGHNADDGLFRYRHGGSFKVLYKDGGATGTLRGDPAHRVYLTEQKVFSLLPLDGVGESFVLIHRDVLAAGVGFAETPYKLHSGGEGLGIMARDAGFEVAGLPQLEVVRVE
ncbi:glycosyltransferase family 32 protein [Devosia beringensis]|uniref:glycosyltransferase family 32 protein n=1 Tax=Devosia beringensis TaxID=2657486 RepID=UPI00186B89AE|nr:glycosyltransferase [Devosia beringensis]